MASGLRVQEPRQERSRESLERVMSAGLDVITEQGWDNFTLAQVCERAGVSVGMLYRRFPGKREFLAALYDRWMESVERDVAEITARPFDWASVSPETAVRAAIDGIIEGVRRQQSLMGIFGLYGTMDSLVFARHSRISEWFFGWFRDALTPHSAAFAQHDPVRSIEFCFQFVMSTALRRGTHGATFDTGTSIGDLDALAEELWSASCAYLMRPQRADPALP